MSTASITCISLCRIAVRPIDHWRGKGHNHNALKEPSCTASCSREQWIAERQQLMQEEKEFTRRRDALGEKRRALPWVRSTRTTNSILRTGARHVRRSVSRPQQLFVQHVMQGPGSAAAMCGLRAGHRSSRKPAAASRESRRVVRGRRARDHAGARRTARAHGLAHALLFVVRLGLQLRLSACRSSPKTWPRGAPSTTTGYCDPGIEDISGRQRVLQGRSRQTSSTRIRASRAAARTSSASIASSK